MERFGACAAGLNTARPEAFDVAPLESRGFRDYAYDLDFDFADSVDAKILTVNVGYFLDEIALDGIEFGIRADAKMDDGLKFPFAAENAGTGRGDAFELLTASFYEAMQGVAGDFETAFFSVRDDQGAGLANENQQGYQGQG